MNKYTRVFRINGILFVADSIEKAISLFHKEYPWPTEVEEVEAVKSRDGSPMAHIAEAEQSEPDDYIAYTEEDFRDNNIDPNYIQSLTISDEPIPTCKELDPETLDQLNKALSKEQPPFDPVEFEA